MSGVLAMGCMAANAQNTKTEYVFQPHWYLQLQGGAQYTLGEVDFGKLISPNAQLGVGYNFSSVLGVRLSVNAWQSKAGLKTWTKMDATTGYPVASYDQYKWKWNYVAPMVDLTVNLSNLICGYNPNRLVNVGIMGGVGANIAFSNSEAQTINTELSNRHAGNQNMDYLWDGTKVRLAGRLGANIDFRLSDAVSLGLEVQANTLNDHYNSKRADNADWYFNALAGIKINLGKTHTTREVPVAVPVAQQPTERVVERIVEKKVPVIQKADKENIRREIFFTISNSTVSAEEQHKIDEIYAFMEKNPEAKVTVTGYADKGTGTAAINERLASQRADVVVKALTDKGIAKDRIIKSAKGDRVQPFGPNDKNRVAICIAE